MPVQPAQRILPAHDCRGREGIGAQTAAGDHGDGAPYGGDGLTGAWIEQVVQCSSAPLPRAFDA